MHAWVKCTLLIADTPETALATSNLSSAVASPPAPSRFAAPGAKAPGVSSVLSPVAITLYLLERHSWLSDMWLYTHLFWRGRGSGAKRGAISGALQTRLKLLNANTEKHEKGKTSNQQLFTTWYLVPGTIYCHIEDKPAPGTHPPAGSPIHLPRRSRSDFVVVVRQQPLYRRTSVKVADVATAPTHPQFPIPLSNKSNEQAMPGLGARTRMRHVPCSVPER